MNDAFIKKLYSTYLSYLPADDFSYPLDTRSDAQGGSAEIMRSVRGQWWVNVTEPGMTKGNHWHHTRTEKFIVVSGEGVIRLRLVGTDDVIEYRVSGDPIEVVDIPPGYTHHIENVGSGDLMTFMWANESFNPHEPDTYPLDV
jgi:UDP-2-acetamido-2,6-beta-L-arabino-hexul-4-ose reductase